ncbi:MULTISPECIES: WD40 repeat domain-containing protein [Tsukamurella]|uniref:WD40 repeat domain-containing protein n=1 Tax=Tsukamurella spumae TaxID=44753 RepID=A0A846X5F0_9ACTN|nr:MULTISPECIES: WD40 repeat domain-containing protein [Tsukamurella]NKY19825.1 WD40 repeat domain-containing protein [Tsukamurella spumae]
MTATAANGSDTHVVKVPGGLIGYAPNGELLVLASGGVERWSADGRTRTHGVVRPDFAQGTITAALSPDGRTLATIGTVSSGSEALVVLDADSGAQLCRTGDADGAGTPLIFSPDGAELVTEQMGGYLSVWEPRSCARQRQLKINDTLGPTSSMWTAAAYSPDGRRLLGAEGGSPLREFTRPFGSSRDVVSADIANLWFSSTGSVALITSSRPEGTMVSGLDASTWDGVSWTRLGAQVGRVEGAALAPDGRSFAVSLPDSVEIRDSRSGAVTRTLTVGISSPGVLAYSRDGARLAVQQDSRGGVASVSVVTLGDE